jgi:hypothetical protein
LLPEKLKVPNNFKKRKRSSKIVPRVLPASHSHEKRSKCDGEFEGLSRKSTLMLSSQNSQLGSWRAPYATPSFHM